MFKKKISSYQYWVIIFSCSGWRNASMASGSEHNLIDLSAESPRGENRSPPPGFFPVLTQNAHDESEDSKVKKPVPVVNIINSGHQSPTLDSSSSNTLPVSKAGKTNKSLFEITRVESHGESVGGDDSELDDTLSETQESSSTSILESIARHTELEKTSEEIVVKPNNLPLTSLTTTDTVAITFAVTSTVDSSSTSTTNLATTQTSIPVTTSQSSTHAASEPPSRFRIVKIAKSKPYNKGKWGVNDFADSQKQQENIDNPSSPMVKRTRHTTESGDQKIDRNKVVTSPTGEPAKSKSSEFIPQHSLPSQSRGSSYNTTGGVERKSSFDSTSTIEASGSTPIVTPMVEALETALLLQERIVNLHDPILKKLQQAAKAFEQKGQIQSIKESMVNAVNDEVRKLKESLNNLQLENNQLREENDVLKRRLTTAEERLLSLDKG